MEYQIEGINKIEVIKGIQLSSMEY